MLIDSSSRKLLKEIQKKELGFSDKDLVNSFTTPTKTIIGRIDSRKLLEDSGLIAGITSYDKNGEAVDTMYRILPAGRAALKEMRRESRSRLLTGYAAIISTAALAWNIVKELIG